MEEAMTQSDAEHGEPVGEPNAGDRHVRLLTTEEDVTDYHGQLLEQLRHVEDNINKFAIQNYAASGAVVLAYLADKAPLWATIIIVALLNINFAIWPAPGSEDTELGVLMELEVGHGETEVYPRVQA
jgi:hypothetical protein